ncbi:MAG: Ig-like domain-containing protein [Candidatus Pacebacteria bacterium]|nr:Ig-like domain-containing protein [Candidatus Paceibacterota bacterium]
MATLLGFTLYLSSAIIAEAASLALSPSTGVYTSNSTFTVRVVVNTSGQSVNASEGSLSFNPSELSVVSVNRTGSIFSLWVAEPSFSNSAGTISFSGGLPSGYSGMVGTIMNVTFRAKGSGAAKVNFNSGSVLANDGRGTNILTSMNGGTYTIQAKSLAPQPEIIEYVAPANTPAAPKITSPTHPDSSKWYSSNVAELSWSLPSGVTAVRTLLNENPTSVPTKVYDNPIESISINELDEGVSYFHLQLKNSDGWGRVTHYRLGVDTANPSSIQVSTVEGSDLANPIQTLKVDVVDETSNVLRFMVKLDSDEPYEFIDVTGSSTIEMPSLEPGYHSVIIEAFDQAGNSIVGTYSFTILAFDKPIFTDYPTEINEEVIPVIKGITRPNSDVEVTITKVGGEPTAYSVTSDADGQFIFIPEGTFSNGVYELVAQASDAFGAKSEFSDTVRIAVQQPGYLRVGSLIVSVLSVLIPLLVLLFILIIGGWYMFVYARRFRKRVRVESAEALQILNSEFAYLKRTLSEQEAIIQSTRKTKKLTKAEAEMIEVMNTALQASRQKVEKEIEDVADLARKENNK